jgi:hypothetical protein
MGRLANTFLYVIGAGQDLVQDQDGRIPDPVDKWDGECDGWLNLSRFDSQVYDKCLEITLRAYGDPDRPLQPHLSVGNHAALLALASGHDLDPQFIRGDSNSDGAVEISDAINTLGYLFAGGGRVSCQDGADSNDDGALDISDALFVLNVLFLGTRVMPQPSPGCGTDPTPDALPPCPQDPAACR